MKYKTKIINADTISSKPDDKWSWMMDYCKSHGLPPAQDWAWDKAEKAWRNHNETT